MQTFRHNNDLFLVESHHKRFSTNCKIVLFSKKISMPNIIISVLLINFITIFFNIIMTNE